MRNMAICINLSNDADVFAYSRADLFAFALWKYVRVQIKTFILHCALIARSRSASSSGLYTAHLKRLSDPLKLEHG